MKQYIEYIRKTILETVTTTDDEKILLLIYGILMNSEINQEHPTDS